MLLALKRPDGDPECSLPFGQDRDRGIALPESTLDLLGGQLQRLALHSRTT